MKKDELIKIAKNFSIDGEPVKIEKCNSGHINKTYAITYKTKEDEQKKYILQYVNTNVFPNLPELMTNIKKITKYMNQKATSNKNCKKWNSNDMEWKSGSKECNI